MGAEQEHDASLCEHYLSYLSEVRHLSPLTVASYGHDLTGYLAFLAERQIGVLEATTMDARRYTATLMREARYGATTINRKLSTLRGLYRYLQKQGTCTTNPFGRIEGNPRHRRLPDVLGRSEVVRILSVPVQDFRDLRDSVMFHLFYATGCRLAELLAANVGDLELKDERMLVRGKGNRQRYVFLNPATVALVGHYLPQRQAYQLEAGITEGPDTHALLIGKGGKRLSASSVHSIFEKYRKLLGLGTRFTPHMLRHSFATHMLDNDSGIRIVQELLGHASISTTQIYTHVTQQRLRSVYEHSHPHGRKEPWKSEEQPSSPSEGTDT